MMLQPGYADVPDGMLASVVTCLEMDTRAATPDKHGETPWTLRHVARADPAWYRELFGRIGSEWLWFSRLAMPVDRLQSILHSPGVHLYALEQSGRDEGLLELDFREAAQCELAFFGLTATLQGLGAGRWLMNRAIELAWAEPIGRFWVHTCTLDHPDALRFYLRSGFKAYARRVEIAEDPRLNGLAPRSAAPGVPLIEPKPAI